MKDESRYILDSILADWHRWQVACGEGSGHKTSAMFHDVRSGRQWDSENDVTDGVLHNSQMETVEFCINELSPIKRTAISINARNLVTGKSVWTSARLPENIMDRAVLLSDARVELVGRLRKAGVM